ncbi:hypothetical protein [Entomohabitans teleogrylli]
MNRYYREKPPHRPGAGLFPAFRLSLSATCRCYTHLGASQDSRAGTVRGY